MDIKKKSPRLLNLSFTPKLSIPLTSILKGVVVFFLLFSFFFDFVRAPNENFSFTLAAEQTQNNIEQERKDLTEQLQEIEKQIAAQEEKIASVKSQKRSLKNEIWLLRARIDQINLKIRAINLNIATIDEEISETKDRISQMENDAKFNREALSRIIFAFYENDRKNSLEILLVSKNLSDFFQNVNNLMLVQESLKTTLIKINNLKENLLEEKEMLAFEKSDIEMLKAFRERQKQEAREIQRNKNEILRITKGREQIYQEILKKTKKTAAEIRIRIFRLLGGGELSFENAYNLAKMAENATGVRAALILAIVDRESSFGRNIGQCNFRTAMHPTRDIPHFLKITEELGICPDSIKVSCPIVAHGAFGGAMGPTQFIPSTWVIYKDKVSAITGNKPASPFSNIDSFMATALYLRDLGATKGGQWYEQVAAAKYYAGRRWRRYLRWFGKPVVNRANSFEEDIKLMKQGT